MNCSQDLLEAYLDEELDAVQCAAVEQHLSTCRDCSEVYTRLSQQKAGVRAAAPYHRAPRELHQSINRSLQRLSAKEDKPRVREMPWRWIAIAASVLLFLSVSWNLLQLRSRTVGAELASNVLADHIRSLLGTGLVEVASSDQHTVKPWFAGKLDFSPEVRDLQAQGFPLAGGRIDYLDGRRVAALVYHRRLHVITLFVWPTDSVSRGTSSISRNGYHLLHWTDSSMSYWAVSDVSMSELETFRALF